MTKSDKYTVTETDANKDGYTTKIDGETTATGTKTGTTKEDGTVVQYVNEKDAAVVTGVAKKYTPYVLLVGATRRIYQAADSFGRRIVSFVRWLLSWILGSG